MGIEMIGKQIAFMRKEKGVKQEELANYVGVSTQAVSKWENGGVPDTELLPKIADFFSVSVDRLFGRSFRDYGDITAALCQKIIDAPKEKRFKVFLNYCWDMERAMFGRIPEDGDLEAYEKNIEKNSMQYSSFICDEGFTRMGIARKLQYFLAVHDIENTQSALFDGVDFTEFFKDFSDKTLFDACVLMHKRENGKGFTENYFVKKMNVDAKKAKEILNVFEKYSLVGKTQIEMDDEVQSVYTFKPTPSFVALLIFAREMIKTPHNFSYFCLNREKPYLN